MYKSDMGRGDPTPNVTVGNQEVSFGQKTVTVGNQEMSFGQEIISDWPLILYPYIGSTRRRNITN